MAAEDWSVASVEQTDLGAKGLAICSTETWHGDSLYSTSSQKFGCTSSHRMQKVGSRAVEGEVARLHGRLLCAAGDSFLEQNPAVQGICFVQSILDGAKWQQMHRATTPVQVGWIWSIACALLRGYPVHLRLASFSLLPTSRHAASDSTIRYWAQWVDMCTDYIQYTFNTLKISINMYTDT